MILPMFKYFLVSSDLHQEKNAISEAAWILSKYTEITNFKPILQSVGGLSLLKIIKGDFNFDKSIYVYIKELHEKSTIRFCHKIIPLEYFQKFSEKSILDWISSIKFPDETNWRITINKRHSNVKTRPLIANIASQIKNGTVDLKNPDKIIQLEIVGQNVGFSVLDPWKILQLKKFLEL